MSNVLPFPAKKPPETAEPVPERCWRCACGSSYWMALLDGRRRCAHCGGHATNLYHVSS